MKAGTGYSPLYLLHCSINAVIEVCLVGQQNSSSAKCCLMNVVSSDFFFFQSFFFLLRGCSQICFLFTVLLFTSQFLFHFQHLLCSFLVFFHLTVAVTIL